MLTEQKSAAQVSREYGIKDSVLSRWKQEFIERSPMLFEQSPVNDDRDQLIAELERMVVRMAMELVTAATTMTKKAGTFSHRSALSSTHNLQKGCHFPQQCSQGKCADVGNSHQPTEPELVLPGMISLSCSSPSSDSTGSSGGQGGRSSN